MRWTATFRILLVCLLGLTANATAADALWIDVRSPAEYATGHLSLAINLPVADIVNRITAVEPDPNRPIKLYCAKGGRAQQAKLALEAAGYRDVTNEGGYADLISGGQQ